MHSSSKSTSSLARYFVCVFLQVVHRCSTLLLARILLILIFYQIKPKQTLQPCRRQKGNKRSRVCHRKNPNISKYHLEMMPIWLIIQALQTLDTTKISRNSSSTCGIFATSRLSRSASVRVHVGARNGHTAGRGALEPPPEAGARTKLFDREFQFRESHT